VIAGLVFVGGIVAPAVIQASEASEPAVAKVFQPLQPPPPGAALDDTRLAKFNGNYFAVDTDPGVSLDGQSSVEIKKIAYGETSYITVTTTKSGTYSSDGLYSPNVRYPGVHTQPLQLVVSPLGGDVLGWSRLSGWVKIPLLGANSIGFLDDDAAPASDHGVCVADTSVGGCR
jgi:hypothetical protein